MKYKTGDLVVVLYNSLYANKVYEIEGFDKVTNEYTLKNMDMVEGVVTRPKLFPEENLDFATKLHKVLS